MKQIAITIIILLMSLPVIAQQADDIIGDYHLPNKLDIHIYKYNNKYYGKIISLNNFNHGQTSDIHNSNKEKQNTPLINMVIIRHLVFNEKTNQWENGKMYGPEKGMLFNLKITNIMKDEIEVVGSKYLFWKTLIWKKISRVNRTKS